MIDVHIMVVFNIVIVSEPCRFYICSWNEFFLSVWYLVFAYITWYWMASSYKCTDSLCTLKSIFVDATIVLLTTHVLSSVAETWTSKIASLILLEISILKLFVLRRVKSVDIWWQSLHRCRIYTFRHSMHVSTFLFHREWHRELLIIRYSLGIAFSIF